MKKTLFTINKLTNYVSLFLISTMLLLHTSSKAQSYQKAYGRVMPDQQQLLDITMGSDKHLYASGTFRNLVAFPQLNVYGAISKLDTAGNLLWYKGYLPAPGGALDVYVLRSVFEGAAGDLYAYGSYLTDSASSYCLMKLNLNGEVQWARKYYDFLPDEFAKAIYHQGYIYIVQRNKIVKLNAQGDFIRAKEIQLPYLTLREIHLEDTNSIYITGDFNDENEMAIPVLKFNHQLDFIGGKVIYSGGAAGWGNVIATDPNGQVIVGAASGVCFSLDTLMQLNWAKKIEAVQANDTNSLTVISVFKSIQPLNENKHEFISAITGEYYDLATFQYYHVLSRLNSNGEFTTVKAIKKAPFPNNNNHIPSDLIVNKNAYYLAGDLTDTAFQYHLNYLQKGILDQTNCGEEALPNTVKDIKSIFNLVNIADSLIVSSADQAVSTSIQVVNITPAYDSNYCFGIPSTLGLSDKEMTSSLQLFPNPASKSITLSLSGTSKETTNLQVQIYSLMGTLVMEQNIHHSVSSDISLETLQPGVYFVVVNAQDGQQFYQKLIKQ